MLGGLAKWLRAVGHHAAFLPEIDDAEVVRRIGRTGEILLTSDAPLLERRAFTRGDHRGLFVPRHAKIDDQLKFVMTELGLPILPPRCMACGGALHAVSREQVTEDVPPRSLRAFDVFYRCEDCRQVFWHGRHWDRIVEKRNWLEGELSRSP